MLPSPVSFSRRRDTFTRLNSRHSIDRALRAPTRLTNFGAILLTIIAAVSLFLNLRHWLKSFASQYTLPPSIGRNLNHPTHLRALTHLIIVPGHSIWTGTHPHEMSDDSAWLLAPYQRGRNPPAAAAFLDHVTRGAELLHQDENALLVFSGGQTSPLSPTTEAESYYRLAQTAALLPATRATTEIFALDSLQNLLFSVARFRELTGAYPHNITVVGYEFKRRRFEELHRGALRWPAHAFEYVGLGVGDPQASAGELANAFLPYTADLYGCHPPLATKRRDRNHHARVHPYHLSAPEMAALLEWCPSPPTNTFNGALPWI
ncbi:hypothetical protein BV25DRAFT_1919726 [Artomyces pyxidatus]|uniref:Uncharacterized protein n=1 Tax=Artomyces pyxidatus TaxID=48021 RepID=A0ACB8SQJ9_9AGAM|nr:hypothetical protein BV25DRAFT_1919726 [Artomyces pyxidatus]